MLHTPHFPKPLPDELDYGHLLRAALLLDFRTPAHLIAHLLEKQRLDMGVSIVRRWGLDAVRHLARASSMPVRDYIAKHTLLPFHRGFAKDWEAHPHDERDLGRLGERSTRVHSRLKFCISCVEQDCADRGVSYWRRTHQLPGIFWCPDHEQLLVRSLSPGSITPSDVSRKSSFDLDPDGCNSIIYRRYAAALRTLLARSAPADAHAAVYRLRVWLQDRGVRHSVSYHQDAKQLLRRFAPDGWLDLLEQEQRGATTLTVTGNFSVNLSVSVALLAALAFEESDIGAFIESCAPLLPLKPWNDMTTREMRNAIAAAAREANRTSPIGMQAALFDYVSPPWEGRT